MNKMDPDADVGLRKSLAASLVLGLLNILRVSRIE